MKKVCFVCLGNICRSPMAEFVMKDLVTSENLLIESRATSNWEHGNPFITGHKVFLKSIILLMIIKNHHNRFLIKIFEILMSSLGWIRITWQI